MTSEGVGLHRLHPLSPVFEIGRSFLTLVVPGLLVLLLAVGDGHEVWYMLAFVPALLHSILRYVTLRYELTDDHLVVREGLVFKKTRHIPYARIQNIDTVQNPLHRLFGVVEVRLETAGGKEPEAVFRVVTTDRLEAIRAGVFAERGPAVDAGPADTERRGPEPFFRMRPGDVVLFGLFSQKGLAVLGGLLFVAWEFGLWERLEERLGVDPTDLSLRFPAWFLAVAGLVLVAALQALSVGWAAITLGNFRIARTADDLRTACGLWTRQSATLPRHRIQFLSVREAWLARRLGLLSVRVLTAGGGSDDESRITRKLIVPLGPRAGLEGILDEVQPEVSFDGLSWIPVHPRARRRLFVRWGILLLIPAAYSTRHLGLWSLLLAPLLLALAWGLASARARRLAWAVTGRAVLMRDGVATHVRNAVRFSKIQSVALTQTPFDRRHRMATLRVDTAGGSEFVSFSVPFLDLRVARRLQRRLRDEAAGAAFRW